MKEATLKIVTLYETYYGWFYSQQDAQFKLNEVQKESGFVPKPPKAVYCLTDGTNYYKLGASIQPFYIQ